MVTWDAIAAECDGYRAGFVAVFRRYEGEPTDEVDAYKRVIKVTVASFARHVGIDDTTFRRWVKREGARAGHHVYPSDAHSASRWEAHKGRQAAKSPTVSVEDKVGMLSDLMSDPKVLRAYRESEAPKVAAADAKAAGAIAKALTDPIARSASTLQVPMWLDQLRTMRDVIAEYEFEEDEIAKLERAVRKLMDELEVQKFRLGMEEAPR